MAIIVRLTGGHSNQMFQYAAGRSLALKRGVDLKLDTTWFAEHAIASPEDAKRLYELGAYNIVENIYKRTIYQRVINKFSPISIYTEGSFGYDNNVANLGPNTQMEGYFQSYKYFEDIKEQICNDFTLRKPANGKNKEWLTAITNDPNAVSLHVRRGDYATNHNATHGLVSLEYYMAALQVIKKKVNKPNIYVFSNDPDWCHAYLKLPASIRIIDSNDDLIGGAEDMRLMRACKHNILANSSFSWWGAWLNQNRKKISIAPKQWFNDSSISTKDLLPESWIQI